jgi:thioester reductase-like protein
MRTFVSAKLPKHSLPSYFVLMDKFPLTPNGKVDKRKLPSPTASLEQRTFEPPLTPTEKRIAKLWSALLKIPNIGREDDFFHIGGHSILAMQLNSLVKKECAKEIPVSLIFEDSTLRSYAARIDHIGVEGAKAPSKREPFDLWRDQEAILDPAIDSKGALPCTKAQYTHPKKIFLTGATGFIGAFFLKYLIENTDATIYCLCRASSEKQALERLTQTLKKYLIWDPKYAKRIIALPGHLEKPLLGLTPSSFQTLASEIDAIFHFGAFVNHAMSYEQHRPANVLGTQEVLRLASTHRLKPLHFISTVAVVEGIKTLPVSEDVPIEKSKNLTNGYVESKWVSEKLILIARSRGIPCTIFRLPRVSGDAHIGSGPTGDFLWRLVQASLTLKMAPKVDLYDDLTPVDYVCAAIYRISTQSQWINSQFHVVSSYPLAYLEVFKFLKKAGYAFKLTDFNTWKKTLVDRSLESGDAQLQALASLLADVDFSQATPVLTLAHDNLDKALKGSGLKCPKIDDQLLKKYVHYYKKIGFLP